MAGRARRHLAYLSHRTGHHHQAVEHYRQALTLFQGIRHTNITARIPDRLGHCHTALGQHHQARTAWTEALTLYLDHGRHDEAEQVRHLLDPTTGPGAGEPGAAAPDAEEPTT
ncbi:tetratricopeptide repeat protein [Saccharothrix australiensis]|uniref:Tetratricopeptide repeat protein n=1 Tax=Saccharothrix australiensis TaxID=2072 RepID=A0A495W171_9PSEU|nr:tetratricopeptide repeat protein [Saccharothrix australiensis]RKT54747.1 tetratricopeptide repeat protein [Saccharothrix australiensis]